MKNKHILTAKGLAKRLGVSERTVRNWNKQGKISSIPIGKTSVWYHLDTVVADLKRMEKSATWRNARHYGQ